MRCIVKKTLEIIKQTGNEAVIAVKNNQPILLSEIKSIIEDNTASDRYIQKPVKGHGRIESRTVEVFKVPNYAKNLCMEWKHIKYIVKVCRKRKKFNTKSKMYEKSEETIHYLSTFLLSAEDFCEVIQKHWAIENNNNYVRDVTLKEDKSRIRVNPEIFSRLRSFALNAFAANKVENIAGTRYINCLDFNNLLSYKYLI